MLWRDVNFSDLPILQEAAANNSCLANDLSAANAILYAKKLGVKICVQDGFIFKKFSRFYDEKETALAFPLKIASPVFPSENQTQEIQNAISILVKDISQSESEFKFVNLTESQKDTLKNIFPKMKFSPTPERCDYIYLAKNLSELPGKKYGKKRNHIHQFLKRHPDFKFEMLNAKNIGDAILIEELWLEENAVATNVEGGDELQEEKTIIQNALSNFEVFAKQVQMTGGILYVKETPAAFCVASVLSQDVIDIHFEKCLKDFSDCGGYAMINQLFAKTLSTKFINREEDLGIEGLRKAKLSYYPEIVLQKWSVLIRA